MNPQHIKIQDYTYELPDERIAKFPMAERDMSKVLLYNRGNISHDTFRHIAAYLPENDLLVYNNTKVIQARMHFNKDTGALIEIFLLEPFLPHDYEQIFQTRGRCSWVCMIGNLKKWKQGNLTKEITVGDTKLNISVSRHEEVHTGYRIDFEWDNDTISFADILEAIGELPIPPYLNRKTEESDKVTYQTVYSRIKGSVAAPTAGLHFTEAVFKTIDAKHIEREELTLHVGAGTFRPVKAAEMQGHEMHTEYISVKRHTIESLIKHGGKAIAVGTTSVRTLESLYYMGLRLKKNISLTEEELHIDQWEPYDDDIREAAQEVDATEALGYILKWMDKNNVNILNSSTQIIIAPGYDYHIVKMLITNFHQPQSTLLLLVAAFIGEDWRKVYDYAMKNDFRFLSYGDSSLLIP